MKKIIARCGFRCDLCPAYVQNSSTAADRISGAAGWSKYFRLKVAPASMRCYGCLAEKGKGFEFPAGDCAVNCCVVKGNLANCSECGDYPCKALNERMTGVEKVIKRFRNKIPKKEFDRFIAPYDARTTLGKLRHTVGSNGR